MKIILGLGWAGGRPKNYAQIFKDRSAAALLETYRERLQHDFSCEARPMPLEELKKQTGTIWVCERAKKSRAFSSEEMAGQFQKVCDSGAKSLTLWIGGPDGLTEKELSEIHPALIWSFGPLTLPHELAAIVAAEQLYRAVSILKNHPYHTGH